MKKLLFLFSVIIISSCNKIEDVIVVENILPPDYTIENTTIENYINKLYISTIGREPTEIEFSNDFSILRESDISLESREIVIDGILNKEEYNNNLFKLDNVENVKVFVKKAEGKKCSRCWKILKAPCGRNNCSLQN